MNADQAKTVNELLGDARALGHEQLYAVGLVNGAPVRFAVVAVSRGEGAELVLELARRTWEGPHR